MLVIRKEQMAVLEEYAQQGFERELAEHVKEFAPKHSEAIGNDGVQKVVRLGVERARPYGFTKRGPVRFYIEMMCMFGSDFDTDPLLPWAKGVLNNVSIKDQLEKADILHEAMLEYQNEVSGPEKKNLFKALLRLSRTKLEDYQSPGGNFDSAVKAGLKNIYPQKYSYLGEDSINGLIRNGKESAEASSISSPYGTALMIVLIFELGHGVTNDPLYPWVSQTLEDESIADPDERAKRLQTKMKTYLDRTLKNLGQEKLDGAN